MDERGTTTSAPAVGWKRAAGYGIRLALSEVKGISEAEVARVVAGRPYGSLADFYSGPGSPGRSSSGW